MQLIFCGIDAITDKSLMSIDSVSENSNKSGKINKVNKRFNISFITK